MSDRRRGPKGIDWDAQPLGKGTDIALAIRLGVSREAVAYQRRKRNIPAWGSTRNVPVDWSKLPLGIVPDATLARRVGLSSTGYIHEIRTRLGIPSWRDSRRKDDAPIDWSAVPWERAGDRDLAAWLGVARSTVQRARKRLGAPAYVSPLAPPKGIDWDALPLGDYSDPDIARMLAREGIEVSVSAVSAARTRRRIPAWSATPADPSDSSDPAWDRVGLGTEPDTDIARRLRCHPAHVTAARWERNIPPALVECSPPRQRERG